MPICIKCGKELTIDCSGTACHYACPNCGYNGESPVRKIPFDEYVRKIARPKNISNGVKRSKKKGSD